MITFETLPYILMVVVGTGALGVGLLLSFRNYTRWQKRRELMAASKPNVANPDEPADRTSRTPRPAD